MLRTFTVLTLSLVFALGSFAQNCSNYFLVQQNYELKFTFRGFMSDPVQSVTYSWDLGDGNTASGEEISHSFDDGGTYLVCLYTEAIDSLGNPCYDTSCQEVIAGNPPGCVALFYAYSYPDQPLTWQFNDFSSGAPTSWEWDFGDGNTSTVQSPSYTYTQPGTYEVCLVMYDAVNNCHDTYCEEIVVSYGQVECESDYTYASGDLLTFDFDGFMLDPLQTDVEYQWDFGDGNTGSGQSVSHTYAPVPPTYYNICLTTTYNVPGGDPCVFVSCKDILVGNTVNCQALFTYAFGSEPLSIDFTDISTGEPSLWEWDFGDSTYSSEQNPTHIYNRDGIYNVCLTITNESNGCTSTLCTDVNVSNVPPPINCNNTIDVTAGADIYSFNFHGEALSNGTNVSETSTFSWNFGDGNTGSGQDVEHTYGVPGHYAVRLATVSVLNGTDTCTAFSLDSVFIDDENRCIGGNVSIANQVPADAGTVMLITHDAASNTILSVKSTSINNDGSYLFEGLGETTGTDLYLIAGLDPQSAIYGQYAPAYFDDDLHWGNAQLATVEGCPPSITHNITLHAFTPAESGSGNISGIVYNGNTRATMENVEILLMNESKEVVAYDHTDADGIFEFASIAYGTYYVYPEMVGIDTEGFMVTISEDTPAEEMGIVIADGAAVLSVEELSTISILEALYPNPANTSINLTVSAERQGRLMLTVYNQLGQQMINQEESLNRGVNHIGLNVSNLPESVYYLRLQAGNSKPLMRSFIKFE